MSHLAFEAKALLPHSPGKISACVFWGPALLTAQSDHSISFWAPRDGSESYALAWTKLRFTPSPVLGMDVSLDKQLLLVLADRVRLWSFPSSHTGLLPGDSLPKNERGHEDLTLLAAVDSTAGATSYAWSPGVGALWVAVKKSVILFRLDGDNRLVEEKKIFAPEDVTALASLGRSALCVAMGNKYWLLQHQKAGGGAPSGVSGVSSWTPLVPCGSSSPPAILPIPPGEFLLGKDSQGFFVDAHTGRASRSHGVNWSRPVSQLLLSPPYILGKLQSSIEVRFLASDNGLAQNLFLVGGSHMKLTGSDCNGHLVLAFSDHAVLHVAPVPAAKQARSLALMGSYDDALALCAQKPHDPVMEAQLTALEASIRLRYGKQLFEEGEYEKAMEQLGASAQVPLLAVLSLFPFLPLPACSAALAPSLVALPPLPTPSYTPREDESYDQPALLPTSSSVFLEDDDGSEGFASPRPSRALHGRRKLRALAALVEYLCATRKRKIVVAAAGRGTEQGAEDEADAEARVLDTALVLALEELLPASHGPDAGTAEDGAEEAPHFLHLSSVAGSRIASCISSAVEYASPDAGAKQQHGQNTAALVAEFFGDETARNEGRKPWVQEDGVVLVAEALAGFLASPNCCDLPTCSQVLRWDEQRWRHLVGVLFFKSQHQEAVDLLFEKLQAGGQLSALSECLIRSYIAILGDCDTDAQQQALARLLEIRPAVALQVMMQDPCPLKQGTGVLLSLLKSKAPDLAPAYLEHILSSTSSLSYSSVSSAVGDSTAADSAVVADDLYMELIRATLDRIAVSGDGSAGPAATVFRQKLSSILCRLDGPSALSALRLFPASPVLWEEKALLLEKVALDVHLKEQHAASFLLALTIISRALRQHDRALKLCNRAQHCSATISTPAFTGRSTSTPARPGTAPVSLPSSPHMTLLRILLQPKVIFEEFSRNLPAFCPNCAALDSAPALSALDSPPDQPAAAGLRPRRPSLGVALSADADPSAEETQDCSVEEWNADTSDVSSGAAEGFRARGRLRAGLLMAGAAKEDEGQAPRGNALGISEEVLAEEASRVMLLNWHHLDAAKVVGLLPPRQSFQVFAPYFEAVFQATCEQKRNGAVVKNLRRGDNLKAREQLIHQRQRVVKVTGDRACAICFKRLGNSVFAVYPSGTIVHFVCYEDQSQ